MLLVFTLILPSLAQPGGLPRVRHWAPRQYGGHNQNWMVGQGDDGLMWVANSAGLLGFDGTTWRLLPLPKRVIARAVLAVDDRVYVGGYGEFGYWTALDSMQPRYVSLSDSLRQPDLSEEIWHIARVGSTVVFQSFAVIYAYDGRRVRSVKPPGIILFGTARAEDYLVPVLDVGLYRWRPTDTTFQFLPGTERLAGYRINGIVADSNHLLIATERHGIWRWQANQLQPWQPAAAYFPQWNKDQINRFQRLRDGRLAVGTILGGLYLLSADGRLLTHLDQQHGLQDNTVLSLFEDRQGDLWVGLDRGLDLVVLSTPLRYAGTELGTAYATLSWHDTLYVGTNRGLFRQPLHQPKADFAFVPGSQGQVWDLHIAGGQLLCGHNNGTFSVSADGLRPVTEITGGWQLLPIPGQEDRLLQATYTGLVHLRRSRAGDWQLAYRYEQPLAPIKQIAWLDDQQLLAVHANRGLLRLTFDADYRTITQVDTLGAAQGLPADYGLWLARFPEGLLVNTDQGVYAYRDGTFRRLQRWRGHRLPAGARVLALSDPYWLLSRPEDLQLLGGDTLRRLPLSLVQSYPEAAVAPGGLLLFGLETGMALLPLQPTAEDEPPPVAPRLLALRVLQPDTLLFAPLDSNRPLQLAARNNHLQFFFTQPVYQYAPRFRYRLRGFDDRWSPWTDRSEREYTNLPPGDYRFELLAEGSPELVAITFNIALPWYRTPWAWLAYLLLLGLLIVGLYRLHHRRLARQRRRLEIERDRRLHEERIRLRNEQLQSDVLRKSRELANTAFGLVRKNELLLELKEEIKRYPRGERYDHLIHIINQQLKMGEEEHVFETNFTEVHEAFIKKLKATYTDLTPGDLRLAAYLKMNLSSKEIAPLLRISVRGVENKRYRLRKKLNLENDDNLTEFLLQF